MDTTDEQRELTSADFGITPPNPQPRRGMAPTVFMEALRPHTYHARPQDVGDVYLAHEHEVENIENLKFAKRIEPPPRAERPPEQPVPPHRRIRRS